MAKNKMISFEANETLYEALRIKAFKEKASISKLIRAILEDQLKSELKSIEKKDK